MVDSLRIQTVPECELTDRFGRTSRMCSTNDFRYSLVEIRLKMNLPDHRSSKNGEGGSPHSESSFTTQCSLLMLPSKDIMTTE
ncbi:hypothetical protein Tco_0854507 [Tanacetum coccineum]